MRLFKLLTVLLETEYLNSAALHLSSSYYFVITLFFIFRSLCAVLGASLSSVGNACSIKSTSDDVVSGTRKVLNTTTTDQNNGVLLKVMSLTRDIACYFNTVGKTYSGNLSKSGVRLLRSCSLNSCAYTSLLRSRCICCLLYTSRCV